MVTVRRNTQRRLLGDTFQFLESLRNGVKLLLWLWLLWLSLLVRRGNIEYIVSNIELEVGARIH